MYQSTNYLSHTNNSCVGSYGTLGGASNPISEKELAEANKRNKEYSEKLKADFTLLSDNLWEAAQFLQFQGIYTDTLTNNVSAYSHVMEAWKIVQVRIKQLEKSNV